VDVGLTEARRRRAGRAMELIASNHKLQAADAEQSIDSVMVAKSWLGKTRRSVYARSASAPSAVAGPPAPDPLMRWNVCERY
jgi:hypothetical protein